MATFSVIEQLFVKNCDVTYKYTEAKLWQLFAKNSYSHRKIL